MRAVQLDEFGPPAVLAITDVPDPVAGPGQVVVDVEFANVTFVETQVRAGRPPNPAMLPALPVIPGNGVGGVVVAVGEGVDPSLVGLRVVSSTGGSGGYSARVVVGHGGLVAVPDELGMAEAVALLADGRTAILLLRSVDLVAGQTVLIEAAGGGVGSLLVQLARNAGARVVGAAGDDRKLDLVRDLGADTAVNYRESGWAERVLGELGVGVDVVFDGVGGDIARAAFDVVRDGGRFAPYGMASGAFFVPPEGEVARRRVTMVHMTAPAPEDALDATRVALAEAVAGRLRPVIGQTFPLEDAARAHAAIEARATIGKTLLAVAGEGKR